MLGAAWGTGPGGSEDFTSCDSFDGCEIVQGGDESSLQLRPNADSLIGTDQCACCLNTEYVRGTDGSCAADPRCSPAELAELECGENAFCSAGECVCMPGWEDPPSCLTFAGSEESDVSGLLALRQGHDPQSELGLEDERRRADRRVLRAAPPAQRMQLQARLARSAPPCSARRASSTSTSTGSGSGSRDGSGTA